MSGGVFCAWAGCGFSSGSGAYCPKHASAIRENTKTLARVAPVLEAEFLDELAPEPPDGEPRFPEPPHGLAYFTYQGHTYIMHPKRFELVTEPGHEMEDPSKPVTRFRLRFVGLARRVATL